MKKILILGASSFIGSNLAYYFRKDFIVYGTYALNKPKINEVPCFPFPITPKAPILDTIKYLRPDFTIYCPALTQYAVCKKNPIGALFINGQAPSLFAAALERVGGRFIYLSTSKVFSGNEGRYDEDSETHPTEMYGQSKLRAEYELRRFRNTTILRLGTIFGLGGPSSHSMFNRILKQLARKQGLNFIDDEFRSFTPVKEVAEGIRHLMDHRQTKYQLFHFGRPERNSYFSFVSRLVKVFGYENVDLHRLSWADHAKLEKPTDSVRHADLTLNGESFTRTYKFRFKPLEDALGEIKQSLHHGAQ